MSLGTQPLGFASLGLVYGTPRTEFGFLIFGFKPNWQGGIKERLSWRTGIFESKNGTEQRQAKRDYPRRSLTYSLLLQDTKAVEFENLLYGSPTLELAIPSWMDFTTLDTAVGAGAGNILLDTQYRGFTAGGYILFFASLNRYEIAQISSISSGEILLTETTFFDWPAGTKAYPLVFTELELPIRFKRLSAAVIAPEITLLQKAQSRAMNLPEVAAPETYLGREVFTFRHNWINGADCDIQILLDNLDSEVGFTRRMIRGKHSFQTFPTKVLLNGRAEIDAFRGFLARAKGRFGTFWVPAQSADFKLISTVAADSRTLICEGLGFPLYTGVDKGRNYVRIQLRSGQVFYREITNASIISGNTELTIDVAFGEVVAPENVRKIDTLFKARLASDEVELNWLTINTVETTLTFRSLV